MNNELETLFAIKEPWYDAIQAGQIDTLPNKVQRFLARAQGTSFTDLDGTDKWYLGRAWANVGEDRAAFEMDRSNPILNFLEDMFSQNWSNIKAGGCYWFDTGLQVGTREDANGDVILDDPDWKPWFPFDYQKMKRFLPDLTVYDYDDDGNPIEPPTVYNIVHDVRPTMVNAGQFRLSKGPYHIQRRTMQVTTNAKLGADAFGVDPWAPAPETRRR